MRLVDGFDPSNGRVEYCRHRMWNAVCSEGWDNNDASVVCRQLGYNPNGMPETIKFHFQCLTCLMSLACFCNILSTLISLQNRGTDT